MLWPCGDHNFIQYSFDNNRDNIQGAGRPLYITQMYSYIWDLIFLFSALLIYKGRGPLYISSAKVLYIRSPAICVALCNRCYYILDPIYKAAPLPYMYYIW